MQLNFLIGIWPNLNEEHQAMQIEVLGVLNSKLKSSIDRLGALFQKPKASDSGQAKRPAVKRWKYIFVKQRTDEAIRSLAKWQKLYDPSWYLILRIASPAIDQGLKQADVKKSEQGAAVVKAASRVRAALNDRPPIELNMFLKRSGLDDARFEAIPHSSATFMQRQGASTWFLVDSIPCFTGLYQDQVTTDVRKLATKLHYTEPSTFHLLKCRGVVRRYDANKHRLLSFEMLFEPQTTNRPRSLRTCLITRLPCTLTERIELARQAAVSVTYVHTLDLVHKNIRPENLISFPEAGSRLAPHFLIGFQQIRNAEGLTQLLGDTDWEKNLYRHPERQGSYPEEAFRMQHDIYSLGVCLLEIGLWESFVIYRENGTPQSPGSRLGLSLKDLQRLKPESLKKLLVSVAKNELPHLVGETYESIVINCLTCLDDDNLNFGQNNDREDEDGTLIGVSYIEEVCRITYFYCEWLTNV